MKNGVLWRRRVFLALLALLAAAGLYLGFRPQPVEVDIAVARRAPLQVTVEQEGRTRVADRYVVAAPVSGYARRVVLQPGDPVRRGQALVQLESARAEPLDPRRRAEAQARIDAAEASMRAAAQRTAAADSNARLAQRELARLAALRRGGYVAAAVEDRAAGELERAEADLRSARFVAATAGHELDAARTALRYAASGGGAVYAVRSPVDGQVLAIPHKSEGPVLAGQPLVEVGDPRQLEAEVDVLSADAVRIRPGTRVLFQRWGGDGALEGTVKVVEPGGFTKVSALGVEEQRVWVVVRFTSPRSVWQRLGDRYRVEASFVLWEAPDVLQVPASALFRDGAGWAVFVVEDGTARRRPVRVGQRGALAAQVVSGLAAGSRVIVHPDDRIGDGVAVKQR